MRYDVILYDIDGTLFDYRAAEADAFRKTIQHFGLIEEHDNLKSDYVRINADLWKKFEAHEITAEFLRVERFRKLLKRYNILDSISPEEMSQFYIGRLAESTGLLPEAREIVDHFHGKVQQVLISNGLVDVQIPRIRNSELNGYFDHIFISEAIGFPKPHPGIFQHVFSQLEANEKNRVIIVGDNLDSDIRGGRDFGIDTCWFNPNKLPNNSGIEPKYEIERLSELKKIIEGGEE